MLLTLERDVTYIERYAVIDADDQHLGLIQVIDRVTHRDVYASVDVDGHTFGGFLFTTIPAAEAAIKTGRLERQVRAELARTEADFRRAA